jgi:thymidylate synthase
MIKEQLKRTPYPQPKLQINPYVENLNDLLVATTADFMLVDYQHHPGIKFPFSV